MDFKERLDATNSILKNCPYETNKQKIKELFTKTTHNVKDDILLRLIVIDSCYSTNLNKRLFGFKQLTELFFEIEPQISQNMDVLDFVNANIELLKKPIGIDKRGQDKGHSFSLITKYLYYRTKFNFPIFDSLVFSELKKEKLITGPQEPKIEYFKILINLKNKFQISIDELDKYFWVCGKVRGGNPSLLISNSKVYKSGFLDKLNIDFKTKSLDSKMINKKISNQWTNDDVVFKDEKLKLIQKLAKSLNSETVFNTIQT